MASIYSKVKVSEDGCNVSLVHKLKNVTFDYDSKQPELALEISKDDGDNRIMLTSREIESLVRVLEAVGVI